MAAEHCPNCGGADIIDLPDAHAVYRGCAQCGVAAVHSMSEVEQLRTENSDLRTALIDACDAYCAHYDQRRAMRLIRAAANNTSRPFSLRDVEREASTLLKTSSTANKRSDDMAGSDERR